MQRVRVVALSGDDSDDAIDAVPEGGQAVVVDDRSEQSGRYSGSPIWYYRGEGPFRLADATPAADPEALYGLLVQEDEPHPFDRAGDPWRFGKERSGPNPPGPGWRLSRIGPNGGKYWIKDESQPGGREGSESRPPAPAAPASPSAVPAGPPSPRSFRQTKSIREASLFAESLGIHEVRFGREENLAAANHFNEGLAILETMGVPMPRQLVADRLYFAQAGRPAAFAVYVPSVDVGAETYNRAIVINPERDWESVPSLIAEKHEAGWLSTGDRLHFVYHEAGHLAYHAAAPAQYGVGEQGNPRMASLFNERLRLLSRSASKQAEKNYREFVAEVFCLMAIGGDISNETVQLYLDLGGPIIGG